MRSAIDAPKRWFLLAALAGTALAGMLLLLPASGEAHRSAPPTNECISAAEGINDKGWGDVCWEAEGDEIWVRDQDPNHWSVRVQLQSSEKEIPGAPTPTAPTPGTSATSTSRSDSAMATRGKRCSARACAGGCSNTRNWTRWSRWYDVEWIYSRCEWVRPRA
jgi:hypothetical protein